MNREILMLVDVMSREKNIDRELVFEALQDALAQVIAKRFDEDADVRLSIDRQTGEYQAFRRWLVVPNEAGLQEPDKQMLLFEAQEVKPNAQVGDFIEEALEAVDFGRIGAQNARQAIMQKMRDAEREQLLRDFLSKDEKVVYGLVKRVESHFLVVELGKLDAVLKREQMIPRENFRVGDRVRAYVSKAEKGIRGVQIELSRTLPQFMEKLFEQQVPEIDRGLLEIMSISRDPGLRAKVSVRSLDKKRDAKGTLIGIKGTRVQAVTNELSGEKVDVVLWSEDPVQFVIEALAPAVVESIVVDEDKHAMDVVVDENNLAIAIGRGGQNVRLASELTGWQINIMTAQEATERRTSEVRALETRLMESLDIEADLADLLIEEGFVGLEEIAYVDEAELLSLEGFDEELVQELRARALSGLEKEKSDKKMKVDRLKGLLVGMDVAPNLLEKMVSSGIKSREDLADLAADECADLLKIDQQSATQLVMEARKIWLES
jgi:N utilization substance protein A